jgi:AraC-like DNA-binding protein
MPVLPLPLFTSLVLAFLLLRALVRGGHGAAVLALIAAGAFQTALVAAVGHYGVDALRFVLPVTGSMVPPSASVAADGVHAAGPLVVAACVALAPALVDVAVPALFAGYGLALLAAVGGGGGDLPRARMESGEMTARVWRIVGAALVVSAAVDGLVVLDHLLDGGRRTGLIVAIGSSSTLLLLGIASLSHHLDGDRRAEEAGEEVPAPAAVVDPVAEDRDAAVLDRLDRLMADRRPHLDPDLSLARLARMLGLPAKQLSAAVNRARGENVSRYVNRHRVDHACRLLDEGASVTGAMLDSGFATKSNFNREFLRVTGRAPSAWRSSRQGSGAGSPEPQGSPAF